MSLEASFFYAIFKKFSVTLLYVMTPPMELYDFFVVLPIGFGLPVTVSFWGKTANSSLSVEVNEHCDEQTPPTLWCSSKSGICVIGFFCLFLWFITLLKSITSFTAARVTPTGRNEWNCGTSMVGHWNEISMWNVDCKYIHIHNKKKSLQMRFFTYVS